MIDIKIAKIIATPYNCGKSSAVSVFGSPVSLFKKDDNTDIVRMIYDYDHSDEFRALHSKRRRQYMMLIGLLFTIEEIVQDRLNSGVGQATVIEFEIITHLHVRTISEVIEEITATCSTNADALFKRVVSAFESLTMDNQWVMRPWGSDPRRYNANQLRAIRRKGLTFEKCLTHYDDLENIHKIVAAVDTIFDWLSFNQFNERRKEEKA